MRWPDTRRECEALQWELGAMQPDPYRMTIPPLVAGVYVCFEHDAEGMGTDGDRGWAGVASQRGHILIDRGCITGRAASHHVPGYQAMREGPLLERAARLLSTRAEVLIVNATGRDHPRRAGLALHLGAVLGMPSCGVTDRPLIGQGEEPGEDRWDSSDVKIDGDVVAAFVRAMEGVKPIVVHPGWCTDLETAIGVIRSVAGPTRTPWPIEEARTRARMARSIGLGRVTGENPCDS